MVCFERGRIGRDIEKGHRVDAVEKCAVTIGRIRLSVTEVSRNLYKMIECGVGGPHSCVMVIEGEDWEKSEEGWWMICWLG